MATVSRRIKLQIDRFRQVSLAGLQILLRYFRELDGSIRVDECDGPSPHSLVFDIWILQNADADLDVVSLKIFEVFGSREAVAEVSYQNWNSQAGRNLCPSL